MDRIPTECVGETENNGKLEKGKENSTMTSRTILL